jgi:hypothetical protein
LYTVGRKVNYIANENESTIYQNLWDTEKGHAEREVYSFDCLSKK